ncbi:MAG: universal stress protein [Actinomycetota bacterium]|nr:universal stress protein [Actinomycetota bacterium]
MKVIVWIAETRWRACVDAARTLAPADADIVLLYVIDKDVQAAAQGAYTGLLGRGRPGRDPSRRVDELATASAVELLQAALQRLGRPAQRLQRRGRIEREVVAAADTADLLILARDGDRSRLGPKSLGTASRFIIEHAPCPVLLVWPQTAPEMTSAPFPPSRPHHR